MPSPTLHRLPLALAALLALAAQAPPSLPAPAAGTPEPETALPAEPASPATASPWLDARGLPSEDARTAITLLATADREGLDPDAYAVTDLGARAAALARDEAAADSAAFAAALERALARYLRDLHEGRVDPRLIGFRMTAPADHHDFLAIARQAGATHQVCETAAAWAPELPLYRGLRDALRRYRELASDPALAEPPSFTATVHPRDVVAGLPALWRWLVALGDLPSAAPEPAEPGSYDAALVAGVERFQARHGLAADGVLGAATREALAVPLVSRVRQIELAMERLRWLPHLDPERFLVVNIPMFRLLAWGPQPRGARPELATGVIVGKALDRQTPVFVETMEHVIFRPYWNIPPSIALGEVLPDMARHPGYLEKHQMEIVDGQSDNAHPVAATAAAVDGVRRGALRIRQRPGATNSLGLVKFVFPNDSNVYLHGTPAAELFRKPRRDFSHGCVRVEDPVALAEWVLRGEGDWPRERIVAAMNGSRTFTVRLRRPIQVLLFYVTAVVTDDGRVRFAADIYQHDARLDGALRALTTRPPDRGP